MKEGGHTNTMGPLIKRGTPCLGPSSCPLFTKVLWQFAHQQRSDAQGRPTESVLEVGAWRDTILRRAAAWRIVSSSQAGWLQAKWGSTWTEEKMADATTRRHGDARKEEPWQEGQSNSHRMPLPTPTVVARGAAVLLSQILILPFSRVLPFATWLTTGRDRRPVAPSSCR